MTTLRKSKNGWFSDAHLPVQHPTFRTFEDLGGAVCCYNPSVASNRLEGRGEKALTAPPIFEDFAGNSGVEIANTHYMKVADEANTAGASVRPITSNSICDGGGVESRHAGEQSKTVRLGQDARPSLLLTILSVCQHSRSSDRPAVTLIKRKIGRW